jgi:hypothetical protein
LSRDGEVYGYFVVEPQARLQKIPGAANADYFFLRVADGAKG